jgi:hypothetical protein
VTDARRVESNHDHMTRGNVEKKSRGNGSRLARLFFSLPSTSYHRLFLPQVTALLSAAAMQSLDVLFMSLCAQQHCSAGSAGAQGDINNIYIVFFSCRYKTKNSLDWALVIGLGWFLLLGNILCSLATFIGLCRHSHQYSHKFLVTFSAFHKATR